MAEMSTNPGTGKPPGLIDSARRLGASMLALAQTRLALASIDLADERDRLGRIAVLVMVAALALALGLASLSGLVLVVFWEEWRIQALAGLAIVYLLIGLWCVGRVRAMSRDAPALFETTLAELERDRQSLRDDAG